MREKNVDPVCIACSRETILYARGLCRSCYSFWLRNGKTLTPEEIGRRRRWHRPLVKKQCQFCWATFKTRRQSQRFCSSRCSVSAMASKRSERLLRPITAVYYDAAHCGKLSTISQRERTILDWRVRKGETLEQIGRQLGVTREAVRQVQNRAVERLQKEIALARASQKEPAYGTPH